MTVERIEDMPPGTVGLRANGALTRDEYRAVVEPAIRAAVKKGAVRLMWVTDDSFEKMEIGARVEDAKTNLLLGLVHHSAWKRSAIVSDIRWVRRAFALLGRLAPLKITFWGTDEEEQARTWVAGC